MVVEELMPTHEMEFKTSVLSDFRVTGAFVCILMMSAVRAKRRVEEKRRLRRLHVAKMQALVSLCELLVPTGEDRNVNAIIQKLKRVAPTVVQGVGKASLKRVAMHVDLRLYAHGDLVFREGDRPSGFFHIVNGAVSIYKHKGQQLYDEDEEEEVSKKKKKPTHFTNDEARTDHLGPKIVALPEGQGFGSFAFSRNGKELRRTASVVADYDDSKCDTFDFEPSRTTRDPRRYCALLNVPNKIYVTAMSKTVDAALQRKIQLLEQTLLFEAWPIEKIYPLAYEATIENVPKGGVVGREGDAAMKFCVIAQGELRITVNVEHHRPPPQPHGKRRNFDDSSDTQLQLAVAILPEGEVLGLVEAWQRLPKTRATATATKTSAVLTLPLETFRRAASSDPRSARIMKRVAANRAHWEAMRIQSVNRFKDAPPLTLTLAMTVTAGYLTEPASVLQGVDLQRYQQDFTKCFDLARFSKAYVDEIATRWKTGRGKDTRGCLDLADQATNTAIDIATRLKTQHGRSARLNHLLDDLIGRRDNIKERTYALNQLLLAGHKHKKKKHRSVAPLPNHHHHHPRRPSSHDDCNTSEHQSVVEESDDDDDPQDNDDDAESFASSSRASSSRVGTALRRESSLSLRRGSSFRRESSLRRRSSHNTTQEDSTEETKTLADVAKAAYIPGDNTKTWLRRQLRGREKKPRTRPLALERRFELAECVTGSSFEDRFDDTNAGPEFPALRSKARKLELMLRETDGDGEWRRQTLAIARLAKRREQTQKKIDGLTSSSWTGDDLIDSLFPDHLPPGLRPRDDTAEDCRPPDDDSSEDDDEEPEEEKKALIAVEATSSAALSAAVVDVEAMPAVLVVASRMSVPKSSTIVAVMPR